MKRRFYNKSNIGKGRRRLVWRFKHEDKILSRCVDGSQKPIVFAAHMKKRYLF